MPVPGYPPLQSPVVLRERPAVPGETVWFHYISSCHYGGLPSTLGEGAILIIISNVRGQCIVRDPAGVEHRLNSNQFRPSYDVATIQGWLHEAHPAAQRELLVQLHLFPDKRLSVWDYGIETTRWRHKLEILRRHGRDLPEDLRQRARAAGLLKD